jgi:hypothetical protein
MNESYRIIHVVSVAHQTRGKPLGMCSEGKANTSLMQVYTALVLHGNLAGYNNRCSERLKPGDDRSLEVPISSVRPRFAVSRMLRTLQCSQTRLQPV